MMTMEKVRSVIQPNIVLATTSRRNTRFPTANPNSDRTFC